MEEKRTYTLAQTLQHLKLTRWPLYRSGLIQHIRKYGRDRYDAADVDELARLLARRRALQRCGILPHNAPLEWGFLCELETQYDWADYGECPQCGGMTFLCPPTTPEAARHARRGEWRVVCGWCDWGGTAHDSPDDDIIAPV